MPLTIARGAALAVLLAACAPAPIRKDAPAPAPSPAPSPSASIASPPPTADPSASSAPPPSVAVAMSGADEGFSSGVRVWTWGLSTTTMGNFHGSIAVPVLMRVGAELEACCQDALADDPKGGTAEVSMTLGRDRVAPFELTRNKIGGGFAGCARRKVAAIRYQFPLEEDPVAFNGPFSCPLSSAR